MSGTNENTPPGRLISNVEAAYGGSFREHLLEQYKMYVDSAQRVSEKRISTGNYLLTVCTSMLTVFGIAAAQRVGGAWLIIIPIAGLLVSLTWFFLVKAYKDLNAAKFRVIHELESYLPVALFRYEWHACEQGQGSAYRPVTHHERVIPLAFAGVFIALGVYAVAPKSAERREATPVAITGTVEVNLHPAASAPNQAQGLPASPARPQKMSHRNR
jgi:hypothetical protein